MVAVSPIPGAESETVVVVGGGIAGLYVGWHIAQRQSNWKVFVLECHPSPGGRISTAYETGTRKVLYEKGPWRIHSSHERTLGLIKQMRLTTSRLPSDGDDAVKRSFVGTSPDDDDKQDSGQKNKSAIAKWTHDAAERGALAADTAGHADGYGTGMRDEEACGQAYRVPKGGTFVRVDQGLSAVVEGLAERAKRQGVEVLINHRVTDVRRCGDGYEVHVRARHDSLYRDMVIRASRCCLAVPPGAMVNWSIYKRHLRAGGITQIQSYPLVHVYARVPRPPKPFAFHAVHPGLGSQIISSSHDNDYLQIAYTGGANARAVQQLALSDPDRLHATLTREYAEVLRGLRRRDEEGLESASVDAADAKSEAYPVEKQLDVCYWDTAVHFWRPSVGLKVDRDSRALVQAPHPLHLPWLVLAGEAVSTQQGWIEGALETAEEAVKELMKSQRALHRLSPLHEAPEHYVEYDGFMIDVSDWAKLHPGSVEAIMNHAGEDVTRLFEHVRHPDYAYAVMASLRVAIRDDGGRGWLSLAS